MVGQTKNLGNLVAYLGLNVDGMMAGLLTAKNAMGRASAQMRSMGRNMTMKISAPLMGMAGMFAKFAADFQTSMRKINTMVGLSIDRVNGMSKGVLKLSNETGRSAVELSQALFTITSAGQRGAESMDILERSAKASAIGLGETRAIAKTVTSAMNAYGKENLSAAKATEILLGTVNRGNLIAEELAPVLGRVIGMASTLGISFEEVSASIATFTRLGVDSAEAVTGLRGIMNSLLKPMDQADDALEKIHTSSEELRNTIARDGLAATLIELVQGFEGNEEAMADIVPNVRALATIFGTAGVQAKSYTEILEYLRTRVGELDKGFKSISQDSGFLFNKTLTQLKNAGIELGRYLLPVVNKVLAKIRDLVGWFNGLSEESKLLAIKIAAVTAAIGPALLLLGTMTGAIALLASTTGLVIAALVALAVGIAYSADNWEAMKERISDWSWWKNMLLDMVQFILDWSPFNFMIKGYNAMVQAFGAKGIPNPFEGISNGLEELKTDTVEYKHQFKDFGDSMISIISKMSSAFKNMLGGGGKTPLLANPSGVKGPTHGALTGLNYTKSSSFGLDPEGTLGDNLGGGGFEFMAISLRETQKEMNKTKEASEELATAIQNALNSAFVEFGETLGEVFSGKVSGAEIFDSILMAVSGFLKMLGTALIAAGVAGEAFKNLLKAGGGFAAIAAGVALVAAAGVVKNIVANRQPDGLAAGGFVESGGIFKVHKGEVLSLPKGSAVTKMNDANKSGSQTIIVRGILSGTDVKWIMDEENRKTNNSY